jgi:hypothetical protein
MRKLRQLARFTRLDQIRFIQLPLFNDLARMICRRRPASAASAKLIKEKNGLIFGAKWHLTSSYSTKLLQNRGQISSILVTKRPLFVPKSTQNASLFAPFPLRLLWAGSRPTLRGPALSVQSDIGCPVLTLLGREPRGSTVTPTVTMTPHRSVFCTLHFDEVVRHSSNSLHQIRAFRRFP